MFINIYKHITTNEELCMSLKDECFYKEIGKYCADILKHFQKKLKFIRQFFTYC